jgi:DNA-binding transcriptional MerR regulator
VAGRSHLSIGEVLSLLHDEFPDVTISKIRFLESQGLVDPERTPSGYRKFYDSDIERLRWVLRQQRDSFLPLKVIKGRLDNQPEPDGDQTDAGLSEGDLSPGLDQSEGTPEEGHATAGATVGAGAGALAGAGEGGSAGGAPGYDPGGPRPQLFDAGPPHSSYAGPNEPEDQPGLHLRAAEGQAGTTAPAGGGTRPGGRHTHRRADGPASSREDRSTREERSSGARHVGGGRASAAELSGEARAGADVARGQELTLEELLEETGADFETVQELEGFALITPKMIGGSRYYPPEAATVTRLASAFARHGVGARHLRAYKGAADREAGLVEQVIMPLIRQRNPEARQAAVQAVEELSTLGGELRAVLLRSALADLH